MSTSNLYSEWRDFYAKHVNSWMSLEELRAECGKLLTLDKPIPEALLVHAMHALEEREKRDEALLRQALEALEFEAGGWEYPPPKTTAAITSLRERLGEGASRRANGLDLKKTTMMTFLKESVGFIPGKLVIEAFIGQRCVFYRVCRVEDRDRVLDMASRAIEKADI